MKYSDYFYQFSTLQLLQTKAVSLCCICYNTQRQNYELLQKERDLQLRREEEEMNEVTENSDDATSHVREDNSICCLMFNLFPL